MKTNIRNNLYQFDLLHQRDGYVLVGIDEAGRGPLAGPVFAAAVSLDLNNPIDGIDDSKKLSPVKREFLFNEIKGKSSGWAVAYVDEAGIDELNILRAALKAMFLAASKLEFGNPLYLVDGNRRVDGLTPQISIVRGDTLSASIAAASIIAKVTRDNYMKNLAMEFPEYGFERHFGYATKQHISALEKHGPCPYHRKCFEPVRRLLDLSTEPF